MFGFEDDLKEIYDANAYWFAQRIFTQALDQMIAVKVRNYMDMKEKGEEVPEKHERIWAALLEIQKMAEVL